MNSFGSMEVTELYRCRHTNHNLIKNILTKIQLGKESFDQHQFDSTNISFDFTNLIDCYIFVYSKFKYIIIIKIIFSTIAIKGIPVVQHVIGWFLKRSIWQVHKHFSTEMLGKVLKYIVIGNICNSIALTNILDNKLHLYILEYL